MSELNQTNDQCARLRELIDCINQKIKSLGNLQMELENKMNDTLDSWAQEDYGVQIYYVNEFKSYLLSINTELINIYWEARTKGNE